MFGRLHINDAIVWRRTISNAVTSLMRVKHAHCAMSPSHDGVPIAINIDVYLLVRCTKHCAWAGCGIACRVVKAWCALWQDLAVANKLNFFPKKIFIVLPVGFCWVNKTRELRGGFFRWNDFDFLAGNDFSAFRTSNFHQVTSSPAHQIAPTSPCEHLPPEWCYLASLTTCSEIVLALDRISLFFCRISSYFLWRHQYAPCESSPMAQQFDHVLEPAVQTKENKTQRELNNESSNNFVELGFGSSLILFWLSLVDCSRVEQQ